MQTCWTFYTFSSTLTITDIDAFMLFDCEWNLRVFRVLVLLPEMWTVLKIFMSGNQYPNQLQVSDLDSCEKRLSKLCGFWKGR